MKKKIRWKCCNNLYWLNADLGDLSLSFSSSLLSRFTLKQLSIALLLLVMLIANILDVAEANQDSATSKSRNRKHVNTILELESPSQSTRTRPNLLLLDSNIDVEYSDLLSNLSGRTVGNDSTNATSSSSSKPEMPLFHINCRNLKIGQFSCPSIDIDDETQQPIGCTADNLAPINCTLRDGLICDDDDNDNDSSLKSYRRKRFVQLAVSCEYTNGYSYEIALLLSIFLGMFGVDRFYLGYPAIGLLKFCTLGFLFLGQFVDIIFIAMQIVKPADGSNYIIKHFGPKLSIAKSLGLNDIAEQTKHAGFVTESAFDIYFYPNNTRSS